ncbi:hypothetical protein Tco_1051639 [Tanacetum coccineum]
MSSITAQQTKLDLELVPKEKRLDIRKFNGRLNPGNIQREPTFQVVLDDLTLTPCYFAFFITVDVPEVYMHQFWDSVYKHDTFYIFKIDKRKRFKLNLEVFRDIFKICPRVQGQDFDALPTDEEIMSFLRDLGHTGKSIHSMMLLLIRCINRGELLLLSLTKVYLERQLVLINFVSPEHKYFGIDNKAYKKQEKMYYPRFTKVIIHHFLTQDKTLSWRNKIGMHTSKDDYLINTLRFVSAKEETQIYGAILPDSLTNPEMKETKAYKTYLVSTEEPMGKSKKVKRHAKKTTKAPARGVVIRENPKIPVSKKKEKVDVTRGKGIELLSQVALTKDAQFEEGNDEDDSNNEQESSGEDSDQKNDSDDDKTQSDNKNKSNSEHENDDNESGSESDQDENEEDEDDEEEVKDELAKTPSNDLMMKMKQRLLIKLKVMKMKRWITLPKTEVPVTSSSHSSDLAAKFLNFSDIPLTDAKKISPKDVYVHHEVPSQQTPTLLTVLVSVISDSSPIFSTSSQPQSSYEAAATLTEFELKKILIDKIDKSEYFLAAPEHRECYEGLIKSYDLDKTIFSTYGKVYSLKRIQKDKDKDEDPSAGSDRGLKKRKTSKDAEPTTGKEDEEPKEKVSFKRDWFTKPTQPQEPTDPNWNVDKTPQQGQNQSRLMTLASSDDKLSKTFDELMSTLIDFSAFIMNKNQQSYSRNSVRTNRNRQKVLVDYFFNNDLKYLQGGISTMTYTTSPTKTKAAQYDLLGIEDIVPNIRGLQSRHDVYSTKRIMVITQIEVMRKHGYGYLKEIVVRRADNDLYRFKEGDFPCLHINDIEDMLLLVV